MRTGERYRGAGELMMKAETARNEFMGFDRVREHTALSVNERIDLLTQAEIEKAERLGPEAVQRRLAELEQEWDVDRALMLVFSLLGGTTFSAGISGRKGWLYFFTVQMAFLGIHAAAGWCPPVSVLRRMGFRTRQEIEAEKHALLSLHLRSSKAA